MMKPDILKKGRNRRSAAAIVGVFVVRLIVQARRAGILLPAGLILALLITTLGLPRLRPGATRAANTTFSEDFTTITYKDTTNTSAAWYGNGIVEVAATGTFSYGNWQYPNTGRMYAESISCADANTCYIAANGATILKTTDGGTTWKVKHDSGFNFNIAYTGAVPGFYAIKAVNSNVVYAAGYISGSTSTRPIVVKTTDGGENWNQVFKSTSSLYLRDIDCVDANNCFFVGGNGSDSGKRVFITTDGGASWSDQTLPAGNFDLYGITAYNDGTSTTLRASGSGGNIIKGALGGATSTWSAESTTSTKRFSDIRCPDYYNCIAVGGYGSAGAPPIWVTHDAGASWLQRGSTATMSADALDCSPTTTSTCWLGGSAYQGGAYQLKTTDGGDSWSSVTVAGDSRVLDIEAVSDTLAFEVGGVNGGATADCSKTTDGTNWTDVDTSLTSSEFRGVDFIDTSTGWASAYDIFKTTNGGSSWTKMTSLSLAMNSVDFIDANNGWFVGNNGVVRKSTDGGSSWTAQTCAYCNAGHLYDIKMWNANVGYLVGGGGQVRYTADGGASGWTAVTSSINSTTNYWYGVWVVNTSTAYIGGSEGGGYNGSIRKTTDSGATWTRQLDAGGSILMDDIFCLDSAGEKCWAITTGGKIYKTTNGGGTWTNTANLGSNASYNRILFLSENVGFAAHNTFLFFTRDGGTTWIFAGYSETNWNYLDSPDSSRNNIWMVGGSGQIDKVVSYFASSSIAQSATIDSVSGDITCANAAITSNTPGGTSVTFQMSNNGGATWTDAGGAVCAEGSGSNFNFASTGSDLRWRATLTSGSPVTASLTGLSVTYTANSAPSQPTNSSPADASTVTTLTPTLTSSAFSDPDPGDTHGSSHWLLYTGATLVENTGASSTDKTSHSTPSLTQGTAYTWSVSHCDQSGACSNRSATTTFTVYSAPNTPTNVSPAEGSTGVSLTPTLTSSAFSDPDPGDTHGSSHWILTGPAGTVLDTGASSTSKTSLSIGAGLLLPSTVYSWKLKHCDQIGACSGFSSLSSFTTLTTSAVSPEAVGPPKAPKMDGAVAVSPTSIGWKMVPGSANATGYEVRDVNGQVVFSTKPFYTPDLKQADETGLLPNVSYCGRKAYAFNNSGYSGASKTYPCTATLAYAPGTPTGETLSPTEVSIVLNPSGKNPEKTDYAVYEARTKQWVSLAPGAAPSDGYTLSSTPLWQSADSWGGVAGFLIGSLTPGASYIFETRVRNLDRVETPVDPDAVSVALTTTPSAAKLSISLGVRVAEPDVPTAGTTGSVSGTFGANRLLTLALLLSALSLLFSSGSLFGYAQKRSSSLELRTLLNLHRHPVHSYALLHGESGKNFAPHASYHRATGLSALLASLVLVAKLAALSVLGVPASTVAEVTGFTDDGATVSSGGVLSYKAVATSEGTDPSTGVSLLLPVPAGTEFQKGTALLDGTLVSDEKYLGAKGASYLPLGDMKPGTTHSLEASFRVLPSATLVSNSALVVSKEFPKGLRSNAVGNPVKAALAKPVPPPPEEEKEEMPPPEEEKKKAVPPPTAAPAITEPVTGTVTSNTTPTIFGLAAPNTVVTIVVNGEPVGTTRSGPDGSFSFILDEPLSEGANSVEAVSSGKRSALRVVTIDTIPPAAPEIAASIVRELPAEIPNFWVTTLLIRGSSPPDTKTVRLTITSEPQTFDFEPEGPEWQTFLTATLETGDHLITVRNIDQAGNKSSDTVVPATILPPECADGIDNDHDGLVDFPEDPGCLAIADPTETEELLPLEAVRQCSDAMDNDHDGLVDFPEDPGCSSMLDNDETDEVTEVIRVLPQCSDGADNDGDGAVDFPSDLGCENRNDPDETDAFDLGASKLGAAASRVARFVSNRVLDNPTVESANEKYAAPTVAAAVAVNAVASVGVSNFLSWFQLIGTQPLLLLSRRKKKGFGLVYNSLSKLPVDLSTVRLLDAETGRLLQSQVTDRLGRYFFLAPAGSFRLEARKQGFVFPSTLLAGRREDASYLDLSGGETITLPGGGPVSKAIPLDPQVPELSRSKVLRGNRLRELQGILAGSGPMLAAASLAISPGKIILAILILHLLLFALFRRLAVARAPKSWGLVRDASTGKPVASAIVRIFSVEYNKLLETKVTDARGRYAFLVGSSRYYLSAEKPGYARAKTGVIDFSEARVPMTVTETVIIGRQAGAEPSPPPTSAPPAPKPAPPSPPAAPPLVPPARPTPPPAPTPVTPRPLAPSAAPPPPPTRPAPRIQVMPQTALVPKPPAPVPSIPPRTAAPPTQPPPASIKPADSSLPGVSELKVRRRRKTLVSAIKKTRRRAF